MTCLGLDIGGANLKAADGLGAAVQIPFALWKTPDRLATEIASLLRHFPPSDAIALTMTGELCDCFPNKAAGVRHIVDAVVRAAEGTTVRVWTMADEFASVDAVRLDPLQAAATNWLALAAFAGRMLPSGPGLLVDLGSTTCDIIPLIDGKPQPRGRTDAERLASGELVYCGVRRTPLCAVFGLAKAAEWFAATADAFVVLGDLPEEPNSSDSADGRPVTIPFARARLARMECADDWPAAQAIAFATDVRQRLVRRIGASVREVVGRSPGKLAGVITAGAGEFLLPDVFRDADIGAPHVSLAQTLGPRQSTAACAHAVAVLGRERP